MSITSLRFTSGAARLRIGEAVFEIRARIRHEPDRVASVLSFGPRAMIALAALPGTDLVQPGSRLGYHYRLILPPAVSPAPTAAISTRSPFLSRPEVNASRVASGMVPPVVLP